MYPRWALVLWLAFTSAITEPIVYLEEAFTILKVDCTFIGLTSSMGDVQTITEAVATMNLGAEIDSTERRLLQLYINATVELLQERSKRILNRMDSVLPFIPSRSGRSWNALGNLWHSISGSPGPDEWKKNLDVLRHVKSALTGLSRSTANLIQGVENQNHALALHQSALHKLGRRMRDQAREYNSLHSVTRAVMFALRLSVSARFAQDTSVTILDVIDRAMDKGKEHYVSKELISKESIKTELARILVKEKSLRPVFGPEEAGHYYSLPLGRTWWTGQVLSSILRIPLINPSSPLIVREWPMMASQMRRSLAEAGLRNILFTTDADDRTYQLIDPNRNCHSIGQNKLCGYRGVRISRNDSCQVSSCNYGYHIIYETSPNTFWVVMTTAIQVTLRCGTTTQVRKIAKNAIVVVPNDCSYQHRFFYIPARHEAAIQADTIKSSFSARRLHPSLKQHEIRRLISNMDEDLDLANDMIMASSEAFETANKTNQLTIKEITAIHFKGWVVTGSLSGAVAILFFIGLVLILWKCGCCAALCKCCCKAACNCCKSAVETGEEVAKAAAEEIELQIKQKREHRASEQTTATRSSTPPPTPKAVAPSAPPPTKQSTDTAGEWFATHMPPTYTK